MGRRHREKRKKIKAQVLNLPRGRQFENELGELKFRMSKAEARRLFLQKEAAVLALELEIIRLMSEKALKDVYELEDRKVFAMIDEAIRLDAVSP